MNGLSMSAFVRGGVRLCKGECADDEATMGTGTQLRVNMKNVNTKGKMHAFGLRALKVHYELVPLVTVIGIAAVGCAGFCVYSFLKPDVMFSRKDEIPSWMRYSADTRQKLLTIEKNWKKDETMEDVERLRKEIGSTH
ncbi:hypothetical protein HPB47_001344 [Ixodes persulcatus]|uniref:Uncharacterized protein n=1 Tax=Ixodes persulcatus TaxID=34615 RepID=A0AC60PQS8_IXOPE|nr:hypothetical protein HPB47_001344 [Ixodes persulcatus]